MANFRRENFSVAFKAEISDTKGKGRARLQEMSKYMEEYMHVRAGRCMNGWSEIFWFFLPSLQRDEDGFELYCALDPSHTGFQCERASL